LSSRKLEYSDPFRTGRYQQAVLDGSDDDFVFNGRITELPENAKNWIEENRE
jgi:hypothetical protein